jgi:hypothetical protein
MKCTVAMMLAFSCLAVSAHAQPLVGHWKFDETSGTTAVDSTGGTNGAIGSNVTLGVPGAVGTAFAFPGGLTQNDVVDFGNATSVIGPITASNEDKMSMSAWLNWTFNHEVRGTAISISSNTTNQNFIQIGVTGDDPTAPAPPLFPNGRIFNTKGGAFGGINILGNTDEVVNTTGVDTGGELVPGPPPPTPTGAPPNGIAYDDGQWHHVVITIDAASDTVELFVDGASVGTNPAPPLAADGVFQATMDNFEVGRLGRLAPAAPYTGQVDDIQIYRRALSASEVSFLFNNPGAVVVPEPATGGLLFVGGLLAFAGRNRRRA